MSIDHVAEALKNVSTGVDDIIEALAETSGIDRLTRDRLIDSARSIRMGQQFLAIHLGYTSQEVSA